jgi:hypothetical protein
MQRIISIVVTILALGLTALVVVAQTPEAIAIVRTTILEDINDRRRTNNVAYILPNETLDDIAQAFAEDLANRPEGMGGDVYLSGGKNIDALLSEAGFPAYSDGYVVDFVPIRLFNVNPDELLAYLVTDASAGADRTIFSRRMAQGLSNRLPLFEPPYREVGIGYKSNAETGRLTYVILLASRPGTLPVVITDPALPSEIATAVSTPNIILRIQNESSHTNGDGDFIGAVQNLRVSEQSQELPCPASAFDTSSGWRAYTNHIEMPLSDGFGLKTLYVQMCDREGRTITSSAQVTVGDPNIAPADVNIMNMVIATQTAAVQATAFEPLRPTVEAILTATAAAP